MTTLLKKLFNRRNENVTLIMLDEDKPENPSYHTIKPIAAFGLFIVFNLVLCLLITLFLYITPFGNQIFDKEHRQTRRAVVEISQKVLALQDSLNARDQQLSDMRSVFAEGSDTVFTINPVENVEEVYRNLPGHQSDVQMANFEKLDANQAIYSRNLNISPDFPVAPPLTGALTRTINFDKNHYGIDIAATEGATARVIADGVVTNADWTINFGYVVQVHHGNGYMSTYKHLSNSYKKKGDIIFKGDILGTVGKSGILTSGPHIHFELWKDGIAMNPVTYLINLIEVN
ncbi:MAG: M23 family metallopeptidase [Balneolales bacterium]